MPTAEPFISAWAAFTGTRDQRDLFAFSAGWNAAMVNVEAVSTSSETLIGLNLQHHEAIYAAYPRKQAKLAAIAAIQRALKRKDAVTPGPAYLLERTQAYAAAVATWPAEERQYIPLAATFFNQGRYDDNPALWVKGPAAAVSQFSRSN